MKQESSMILRKCKKCKVIKSKKDFGSEFQNEKLYYRHVCKDCRLIQLNKNRNSKPFYAIWVTMKGRCQNPNDKSYKNYGGRGIKVCNRWQKYENFKKDMLSTYFKGASIERIDVNGHYELVNCKWIKLSEQAKNRRDTIRYTFDGKTKALTEWAKELKVSYGLLYDRIIRRGWSVLKAFTQPIKKNNSNNHETSL